MDERTPTKPMTIQATNVRYEREENNEVETPKH